MHKFNLLKQPALVVLLILLPLLAAPMEQNTNQDSTSHQTEESSNVLPQKKEVPGTQKSVFASFKDFPNLHPMVVHFPIVLLFLAFITQLLGFFMYRKEFSWITLFLLLGGFIGAVLATQVFHAHAGGVSEHVHKIFETHEYYGKATLLLSGIALVLKILSHFLLRRKLWAEIIVFLVVTASTVTVGLAGHLGSQLVNIENVGPQGHHLVKHHNE